MMFGVLSPTARRMAAATLAVSSLALAACSDRTITAPRIARGPVHDGDCIIACDTTDTGTGGGQAQGPTGGIVIPGYPDFESCYYSTAGGDADQDGVDDGCEYAIAAAFAPMMEGSASEADFNATSNLVGGEYYWAVTRSEAWFGLAGLRIAYLPAYYVDEGTGDLQQGGAHDGDSEFIVIDVTAFNGKWSFTRAFLSAHCGATQLFGLVGTAPDCQWWNADSWDNSAGGGYPVYVDNVSHGAPYVWVSHRKHAHYYSHSKCEGGSLGIDSCDGAYIASRFPVTPGFNVGSSLVHLTGPVQGRRGDPQAIPGWFEDLWSTTQFRGWQAMPWTGDAPTPYGQILQQFGF